MLVQEIKGEVEWAAGSGSREDAVQALGPGHGRLAAIKGSVRWSRRQAVCRGRRSTGAWRWPWPAGRDEGKGEVEQATSI